MTLPVTDRPTRLAALAALTGVADLLVAAKVHLFAAPFIPSLGMVLTSFVEATYTGYAAVAIGTFGLPYFGGDGFAHVTSPSIQFQPSDAVTPNTIYGAYITNTAGTVLIYAVAFDIPVSLADATDALIYEPDWIYGM